LGPLCNYYALHPSNAKNESADSVDRRYFAAFLQSRRPEDTMKKWIEMYFGISGKISLLQSPFLLAVRLYWGWQFAQTGWGKLHNIAKITDYFASLNIPFPAANAHFIAGLEFFGGLLLILGLGSRLVGLLLAANMLVAYWTADHDALVSIFSDPGTFYVADPYTCLFASLLVLIFGAGWLSLDTLIQKRLKEQA
jgi:putative oxidoreductase